MREETKQKISTALKKSAWLKGKKLPEEIRLKIKETMIGMQTNTGRTHFKIGSIPWNKDQKGIYSPEHIEKLRSSHIGRMHSPEQKEKIRIAMKLLGERNHLWKDGRSLVAGYRKSIRNIWAKNNPEKIAHLKARRYAREKGAEGSHSLTEWNKLKEKHKHYCASCLEIKSLTKDHIIPLSKKGTDYIENIQPLCRSCNSKKHNKI